MPKFRFSKLVRDNIVEQQIASGAKPTYRQLGKEEHKRELVHKLIEEAKEITLAPPGKVAGEIADAQQALDDLTELHGLTAEDIAQAQAAKNKKSGAFKMGLFVTYVEVEEDNPWTYYYRQNADRYPEVD